MTGMQTRKLAVLWRGDREARCNATPQNNRFKHVFEELATLGISAEPAVYADDMANEVREQLLNVDGVLVWVNPISEEQNRTTLDAMLRDVTSRGIWVSADPDVILKMGVKEVLHRTKHLGWGTDTHLYRTGRAFREEFPVRLQSTGPRVLSKSRERRAGRVEGRTRSPLRRPIRPPARNCSRSARTPGQRARRYATRRLHEALRGLFRSRRLHRRSTAPSAATRRHDPLLHGRR